MLPLRDSRKYTILPRDLKHNKTQETDEEDHCRGQDQEVHSQGWTLSHIIPIQEIQVTIHLWIMNRAVEKDFQKAKTKADV